MRGDHWVLQPRHSSRDYLGQEAERVHSTRSANGWAGLRCKSNTGSGKRCSVRSMLLFVLANKSETHELKQLRKGVIYVV